MNTELLRPLEELEAAKAQGALEGLREYYQKHDEASFPTRVVNALMEMDKLLLDIEKVDDPDELIRQIHHHLDTDGIGHARNLVKALQQSWKAGGPKPSDLKFLEWGLGRARSRWSEPSYEQNGMDDMTERMTRLSRLCMVDKSKMADLRARALEVMNANGLGFQEYRLFTFEGRSYSLWHKGRAEIWTGTYGGHRVRGPEELKMLAWLLEIE